MSPENATLVMQIIQRKLPEETLHIVRDKLKEVPDERRDEIISTPLIDVFTVLLFSIFLGNFGVDRFYIGDTKMGILKLLLGWLTLGIFSLIDIYFCYKKVTQMNYETLLARLT